MNTKRRVIGAFIVVVIVLSCTLASASARILDKSIEVGESGVTATVTGINDDDTSSFLPMQVAGEFEWEVTKKVWDPVSNTWVQEINAKVGDIVTFQINTSCQNLSQIICDEGSGWAIVLQESPPKNFRRVDYNETITQTYDGFYWNSTYKYAIEGCSDGINEYDLTLYCINWTTLEWEFQDRISDTATIRGVECPVPAYTPIGLIALVSLLSAIAAVTIVRKRR